MKASYGIAMTGDGRFCLAGIDRSTSGWRVTTIRKWDCGNKVLNQLPLSGGVYCAIASIWKSPVSMLPAEAALVSPAGGYFAPAAYKSIVDRYHEALSGNLLGIVPDDAFLSTVPMNMGETGIRSFVAVFRLDEVLKIGLTVDGALIAVFDMQATPGDALEYHLARIRRYCNRVLPDLKFPDHLYLIGGENIPGIDGFSSHVIPLLSYRNISIGVGELRALGAALLHAGGIVPLFEGASPESDFRRFRVLLYVFSLIIVLAALIGGGICWTFNKAAESAIGSSDTWYKTMLKRDIRIGQAAAHNDSTAAAILQLHERSAHQTRWGEFLQKIGEIRPDGVFFDKLGSEQSKTGSKSVRIMLSGWSRNESAVTGLLDRLQQTGTVSDISLASLERSSTKENVCTFKIMCTLSVFES